MEFTPGPWRQVPNVPIILAGDDDATGRLIASTAAKGTPFIEQNANARLVAAAPDLLAALRDLREICAKMGYFGSTMDAAHDAIAKATTKETHP